MVQLLSIITAAALFSQAVLAGEYPPMIGRGALVANYDTPVGHSTLAPMDRRSYGNNVESSNDRNNNYYYNSGKNNYNNNYNEENNKYEDNKYDDNKYDNNKYETDKYEGNKYNDNKYEDNKYNNYEESTSTKYETDREDSTSTSEYVKPTYGSGSNNWGNGYNDCVSKCIAQFGNGNKNEYQNNLNNEEPSGAVHTVLVAPDGAGLRYMPFALNATVGDTIRYVWTTPNNHTATLSSELAICNKSGIAEQRNFVSGVRNASVERQIFDVIVQTEEPQFFYCSVKTHCKQGMFGIINPKSGGSNTVGSVMKNLMDTNPDLQSAWNYMSESVQGTSAENWGTNIDVSGIPENMYSQVAANVMFTQTQFAANPGSLETDLGASTPDQSPFVIVPMANTLLSNSNVDPNANTNKPTGSRTGAAPTPSDLQVVPLSSGAGRNVQVGVWVTGLVGIVSWLLL